jgi:hypothetical protein
MTGVIVVARRNAQQTCSILSSDSGAIYQQTKRRIVAMSWYDTLKDFQPLIAAFVALAAAITAYLSAQSAARKQSRTTLRVQQNEFEEAKEKEERARRQREIAILIRLNMKFEITSRLLEARLSWPRFLHGRSSDLDEFSIWTDLKQAPPLAQEAHIDDISQEDLEHLRSSDQMIYHSLYLLISTFDRAFSAMLAEAERESPKRISETGLDEILRAGDALTRLLRKDAVIVNERIEMLGKES